MGCCLYEDTITLTLAEEVSGLEQLAPVDVKARVEMVDPHFIVVPKGNYQPPLCFLAPNV